MNEVLKPCPFCGGTPTLEDIDEVRALEDLPPAGMTFMKLNQADVLSDMDEYKVLVHLEFKSEVFNDVYTVSAYSRDSAVTKAKGRIFSENELDELVEVTIMDVCKV